MSLIKNPLSQKVKSILKEAGVFNMSQNFLDESRKPSQYFFDKKILKYPLNLQFFSWRGSNPSDPRI